MLVNDFGLRKSSSTVKKVFDHVVLGLERWFLNWGPHSLGVREAVSEGTPLGFEKQSQRGHKKVAKLWISDESSQQIVLDWTSADVITFFFSLHLSLRENLCFNNKAL